MKYLLLTTIATATLLNVAAEEANIPAWKQLKNERKIKAPGKTATIGVLPIDYEIFNHTRRNMSDFRILNSSKQEVPYVIRKVTAKTYKPTKMTTRANIISLTKSPDKSKVEVIISVPKSIKSFPIGEMKLETDQTNFEKSVSIFGSNDRRKWTLLKQNAAFCDYSKIIDLRITKINWKPTKFKYYKLIFNSFQEIDEAPGYSMLVKENTKEMRKYISRRDIRINRILLYTEKAAIVTSRAVLTEYPVKVDSISNKNNQTEIEISAWSCPLTEIKISTDSVDFSRNVTIYRLAGKGDNLYHITSSNIRSFKLPGYSKNELKVPMSETRAKRYRITITNNDSPPLEKISVKAYGPIYQAEFLTSGLHKPLTAYYGGDIPAPVYDIAEAINRLKHPNTCDFVFGETQLNQTIEKKPEPCNLKWLVWVAFGLIVAALSWILAHNMKKFDDMEPDEGE